MSMMGSEHKAEGCERKDLLTLRVFWTNHTVLFIHELRNSDLLRGAPDRATDRPLYVDAEGMKDRVHEGDRLSLPSPSLVGHLIVAKKYILVAWTRCSLLESAAFLSQRLQ